MSGDNSLRARLGQRIRQFRTSRGITGSKLAELAKISPAYLSEVERGLSEVSSEKLLRIAQSLGISVQDLLDEAEISEVNRGSNTVSFPASLAEAAERMGWSFRVMSRLYEGQQSLRARRSSADSDREWKAEDWVGFYESVQEYIDH